MVHLLVSREGLGGDKGVRHGGRVEGSFRQTSPGGRLGRSLSDEGSCWVGRRGVCDWEVLWRSGGVGGCSHWNCGGGGGSVGEKRRRREGRERVGRRDQGRERRREGGRKGGEAGREGGRQEN